MAFPHHHINTGDLIRSLSDEFHVISPDYPGFGLSDVPDPATYSYSFESISQIVENFLQLTGFDHYGLYAQDYGGPVGFRIACRNPEALDWLIIQNTNAYEVGFTAAWDGFRNALWKNRSAETEEPLAAFLTYDAIKSIYLGYEDEYYFSRFFKVNVDVSPQLYRQTVGYAKAMA